MLLKWGSCYAYVIYVYHIHVNVFFFTKVQLHILYFKSDLVTVKKE